MNVLIAHCISEDMTVPSSILSILFAIGCTTAGSSIVIDAEPYDWNERNHYYFRSLKSKMDGVLSENCLSALNLLEDGVIRLPNSSRTINVASMPVDDQILRWWQRIEKPKQMRVDPNLCDAVMMYQSGKLFCSRYSCAN